MNLSGCGQVGRLNCLVVDLSPDPGGARQPAAYQTAFAVVIAIEGTALAWFAPSADGVIRLRSGTRRVWPKVLTSHPGWAEESRHLAARQDWNRRLIDADYQVRAWRMAALASMTVLFVLATLVLPLSTVQPLASSPFQSAELPDDGVQ